MPFGLPSIVGNAVQRRGNALGEGCGKLRTVGKQHGMNLLYDGRRAYIMFVLREDFTGYQDGQLGAAFLDSPSLHCVVAAGYI